MLEDKINNLVRNLRFLIETKALKFPLESVVAFENRERQLTVDELLLIEELTSHSISSLLNRNLSTPAKSIKMLIMDCDGVLTDGAMIFTKNGDEIKRFNAKDGMGIKNLHKQEIKTGIISAGRSTGLVEARAEMLGIEHVYVGHEPKLNTLESWLKELDLAMKDVAYIGDDISDLPILEQVGLSACPADAVRQVREKVQLVLKTKGGQGCVRELVDEHILMS